MIVWVLNTNWRRIEKIEIIHNCGYKLEIDFYYIGSEKNPNDRQNLGQCVWQPLCIGEIAEVKIDTDSWEVKSGLTDC
jgi:hypothetical protein